MFIWHKAKVIRGEGRGKKLGYPTANIKPPSKFDYRYGIYTAQVKIRGSVFEGILYWGTKGGQRQSLEVHIFDFDGDLYDQILEFKIGCYIREDRTFASLVALTRQMDVDVKSARDLHLRKLNNTL